jgi:hypothetical protein
VTEAIGQPIKKAEKPARDEIRAEPDITEGDDAAHDEHNDVRRQNRKNNPRFAFHSLIPWSLILTLPYS